jgi:hypothetical protein
MTATHTPTPWSVGHGPNNEVEIWGRIRMNLSPILMSLGFMEHDPREANAAIIVEAVNSHASLKARIQDLEAALQVAQELFAIVVNPQDHPNTSVQHLWAQCVEAECKIRDLLKDGAK